jgi:hypothetical protein
MRAAAPTIQLSEEEETYSSDDDASSASESSLSEIPVVPLPKVVSPPKPKSKPKAKSKPVIPPTPVPKKAKAPAPIIVAQKKKKVVVVEPEDDSKLLVSYPPDKLTKYLAALDIPCSENKLKNLLKLKPEGYKALIKLVDSFIYLFSSKSPIGRMFWYIPGAGDHTVPGTFKCVRNDLTIRSITNCESDKQLNMPDFASIDAHQQADIRQSVGIVSPDQALSPAQLLFGLLETNYLPSEKSGYTDAVQRCWLHDTKSRETHHLNSKEARAKMGLIFLTRTRAINDKNLPSELEKLAKKRQEILDTIAKHIKILTGGTVLEKKKKVPEEETTTKKTTKTSSKKPIVPVDAPVESKKRKATEEQVVVVEKKKKVSAGQQQQPPPPKKKIKLSELSSKHVPSSSSDKKAMKKLVNEIMAAAEIKEQLDAQLPKRAQLSKADENLSAEIKWFREHCS